MSDQEEVDGVVHDFLVESYENLERLDREFVDLERDPGNREILASIFRTIHTIKGTCGFLGFGKLENVAHKGENLLSRLRDGVLQTTPEIATALLAMVDAIREILAQIEGGGVEGDGDYTELVEQLVRLATGQSGAAPPAPAATPSSAPAATPSVAPVAVASPVAPAQVAPLEPVVPATAPEPAVAAPARSPAASEPAPSPAPAPPMAAASAPVASDAGVEPPPNNLGDILIAEGKASAEEVASAAEQQRQGDPRRLGEILVEKGAIAPPDVTEALQKQKSGAPPAPGASVADTSIRVDVSVLDQLMNLVGELVLARNQMLQFVLGSDDSAFTATCQRLNLVTTELQEGIMKTRMQPIGSVWSKFPRVVRDLSRTLGKQIRLEMDGKETELDRTLIEAIKDPLTHLVRNAVDHGVEMPEQRRAAGKAEEGRLLLSAFHEGGLVNILISDDGGGIDPEKIKAKAVQKGLIGADQAARMGEREALGLVFLPGFSTAEKVSNISGRGVGMDVVKTNIERIGGAVDVQSTVGQGSTFKIKIPLTLAIIPALIVRTGAERFAIPQVSLVELVRLEGEAARLEQIHGVQVHRLRGKLLPIVHLREALGRGPTPPPDETGEAVNIVVLQADDRQFGLVVDAVLDTEEIVVKPLGKQLKGIACLAGATILGDGKIALILDALGIAQRMHVVSEMRERALGDGAREEVEHGPGRQTLLVIRTPDDGRMAIPLAVVSRLEEFTRGDVESVGSQQVIQYRGEIMPLIEVSEVLPERRSYGRSSEEPGPGDTLHVVVHSRGGRSVGLVVDEILDIVDERVALQRPGGRTGVLGTVVIHDRVTELIDLEAVIATVDPEFFAGAASLGEVGA